MTRGKKGEKEGWLCHVKEEEDEREEEYSINHLDLKVIWYRGGRVVVEDKG